MTSLFFNAWRPVTFFPFNNVPFLLLRSSRKISTAPSKYLQQHESRNRQQLKDEGITTATTKALVEKGLIEVFESEPPSAFQSSTEDSLPLNSEQQQAVDTIKATEGFHSFLLEGITGSGKTEVYLQLIEHYLQQGKQALVLVPEIGLTPQTLNRFQRRFRCPIITLHSAMTDNERLKAWEKARRGKAGIVIGTRSAVFTPLANPGIIIIDEEHDSSFKQQDGFRYSARDVAIKRAATEKTPIVLGSATPSLESLHNALTGRYQHLQLTQRATGATAPRFELLDIRHAPMDEGFSPELLRAIRGELNAGNQVLVFINRRGFSPVLICHDCGFVAQCHHCDARLTVHYQQRLLRCHHCESQQPLPSQCPECHGNHLDFQGIGTERSEQALQRLFPNTPVLRIDRDTTSRKYAMQEMIEQIHRGEPSILVGTQMLAKGHHFADVTLVAVLDADGGLFSADFRAPEKMGQLLIQVAGRAGREQKPGRVIIQTHQPDHPLMISLVNDSYQQFARQLLEERKSRHLPPFSHLALVKAEARSIELPEQFLRELRQAIEANTDVQMIGPLPAPMARRAGHFRVQLLLQSGQRSSLHQAVTRLCSAGDANPLGKKVRWHIDIDPIEAF
jgi:primosomal protein N' (replication factor Y)